MLVTMNAKSGSEIKEHTPKQMFSNGLASSSTSSIATQNNNGLVRQKTNVRATSAKYYDIASTILGGSGDVEEVYLNAAKNGNLAKLEQLLQQKDDIGLDIDCKDKRTGNTALIWAAKRGHSKIVELLLRHGADATLCNYEAQTALETAFSPIRTVLLDWVEKQEELNNHFLLQAAWQGNFSIVRKILTNKRNVDVNCQNAEGLTPLMLVCRDVQLFERMSNQLNRYYSPVQVVQELINAKANIHVTDNDGRSCLHYASQSRAGCADGLIAALVSGGMDVELRDKRLFTPLHLASQLGNTNNVVALAEGGSDVNVKGFAGLTPLHMTAYNDHHITAVTLLNHGADVTITDDRGLTPADLAKTRKMKNTLKEAWAEATKGSNPAPESSTAANKDKTDDGKKKKGGPVQKKRPEVIIDNVVNSSGKATSSETAAKSNQAKTLSSVERCKQAEKKILQEVEAFKAAHPVLQRETTRMLGTSRTKILPQIGRSSSPEQSSMRGQASTERNSSPLRGSDEVQRSLDDARSQLISRGRSVSDIKIGVGRQSEISGSVFLDDDSSTGDGQSSRLSRTSPIPRNLGGAGMVRHRRSDSDPAAPSLRDLAASCETVLPSTRGARARRQVRQQRSSNGCSPSRNIFITQKNTNRAENGKGGLDKKGASQTEEDLLRSMESPFEIVRCRSILKEEFILEESRPKEASSGSDPTSSTSSSSLSSPSPRDPSYFHQSTSRSLRHDPSLSTLLEQPGTAAFPHTVQSSFSGGEGVVRPQIRNPQQRIRRKSENSLTSSIESDPDFDLRLSKPLARSHSLRKSDEKPDFSGRASPSLSMQLAPHKSQSMESISPRTQFVAAAADPISSKKSMTSKSSSEGNLELTQKTSVQASKSDPMKNISKQDPSQPKGRQISPHKSQSLQQWAVEPFSGKARVLSGTATEDWDSFSNSANVDKNGASKNCCSTAGKISQARAQSKPGEKGNIKDTDVTKSCSGSLLQYKVEGKVPYQQERPKTVAENRPGETSIDQNKLGTRSNTTMSSQAKKSLPDAKQNSSLQGKVSCQTKPSVSNTTTPCSSTAKSINVSSSCLSSTSSNCLAKSTETLTQSKANEGVSNEFKRLFVVTEESQRLGSASKQRLEERTAVSQSKAKEANGTTSSTNKQAPDGGSEDPKSKSCIKAASIEKTIMKNQPKTSATVSQGKGKIVKVPSKSSLTPKSSSNESLTTSSTTDTKSAPAKGVKTPVSKSAKVTNVKPLANTTPSKEELSKTNSDTAKKASQKEEKESKSAQVVPKVDLRDQGTSKVNTSQAASTATPLSDTSQPPQHMEPLVKIRLLSSSGSSCGKTPNSISTAKTPIPPENEPVLSTPVIVNPFEEFVQAHIKVIENSSTDALVKTKKTNKTSHRNQKKASASSSKRPNSGSSRQSSANKKRGTKGKDTKAEKEPRPKSGGKKSGKGQKTKEATEEDTTETEVTAEAAKPDTAIISGIGWQLSATCRDKSDIKIAKDVKFAISDSDFSEDSDNDESQICSEDRSKEALNKHLEVFREKITQHSPRFLEMKRRENSLLEMKLPLVEDDGFPPMNLDMTQHVHNDPDHKNVEEKEHFDNENYHNNHAIQHDIFLGKLTPIPEASFLSKTASAISAFDKNFKGSQLSLLLDGNNVDEEGGKSNNKQCSKYSGDVMKHCEISGNIVISGQQKNGNVRVSKEYENESSAHEDVDDRRTALSYEYTPSGKVVRRTQSLKEFKNLDKPKREFKFSESRNHERMRGKGDGEEEDIDDVIDEILSSTTSSMASTLRNLNQHAGNQHHSGGHTLTEGDKNLLLKMSSSKNDSPFHAHSSSVNNAQQQSAEAVVDLSDVGRGSSSAVHALRQNRSSVDTAEGKPKVDQSLTDMMPTVDSQNLNRGSTSTSSKPPPSSRSLVKEEVSPRRAQMGRSLSTRERRRQRIEMPQMGHTITDEEAKQLAKVINSFKHMELHATAQRTDGFGGSAKSPSRNTKLSLRSSDSRPASTGASFRSKGKFQELKDGSTATKMSVEVKDVQAGGTDAEKAEPTVYGISQEPEALLQHIPNPDLLAAALSAETTDLPFESRRGSIAGSECTVDSIKSGGDDTIQWKKGNVLGRGAFGIVWCGLTNEGQLIAVKQIELTTMEKTKAQLEYEKVQEEVELLKTLEHVNIVGYLGTSLEDNIVSIFMQFIPGGSIASILARFGALDESVFRRYTKQILQGVEYLHENDVIHRDIKGANVMLMPNGVIKLIDFGCAKRLCINLSISQTEILKSMKGTPFWMAPEVVNETGHGKKSDIWSIGCTVFEMATRKPPWADMNPMAAIFAIGSLSRPVPTLDDKFSQDARDFVSLCLTRDQEKRPSASELLEHSFITRRTGSRAVKTDG